ncbi:hypothetical protein QUF74_01625 [Candidatus Halobeggiatoa sp. HSG11]|nr:hypothetical protein [Candidatus Halobeggiatoa sp. HSG11]
MEIYQNVPSSPLKKGTDKTIRWLLFSVLMALLPIVFNALSFEVRGQLNSFSQLISRGELLLIATAICTAAIGELFVSGSKLRILKAIIGGFTVMILTLATAYFVDISAIPLSDMQLETKTIIVNRSILIFECSVIFGGCCTLLSEY